jgi:4-methylaminobutanoate oxidase (formaldehyde-forming)
VRDRAAVVVVGGGIIGVSVAYHLALLGVRDVVLVEKGELTSGTTFHSVGLVSQFRSSPADIELMRHSVRLYRAVSAQVGAAAGWNPVGSLRLAGSADTLKALHRHVGRARTLGLAVEVLSPAEACRLVPAMSGEGLHGAVHVPDDGYLEPAGMTAQLARLAREGGVTLSTQTRVTAIERDGQGRIAAVVTDAGTIRTGCVVNAAGQWAPRVAAMVGRSLPIVPLMHQYLTTRPIPGEELPRSMPVVRDPDSLVYVREEVGGFLVGGFEADPKAWAVDGVPWEFTERLLAPDWDLFAPLMEGAVRRFPVLEKAEAIQLVNGPDGFTPDGHYALGPLPGVPGFYVAAGMSINGIAGAGGVGRVLAEWIADGAPSVDVSELDVRRFGQHLADVPRVTAKAREVYRFYYRHRFPHDEGEWGRPGRASPLHERLLTLGAVFGERGGWERANYFAPGRPGRRQGAEQRGWGRPPWFDLVGEEHRAVRERVGVLDMTSFGKLDVTGPEALAFLQRLCANDVDRPAGSLVHTQMLNARGGIEGDVTVTRLDAAAFRVTTGTASAASDLGWLLLHQPLDGSVTITDVTESLAVIGVWGPDARRLLTTLTSADVSKAAFPYLTSRLIDVTGVETRATRVSFAGELGWELVVARADAGRVWDVVLGAGRALGIRPVGDYALNTLRLEKGFGYWGDDLTPGDTPFEAGLGFCVRVDKGEFVGRAVLLRQRAEGVPRRLMPLTTDGEACVLYGGETVLDGTTVVGRVRSGGYGYTVAKNGALAYLPAPLPRPGTRLHLECFGERVPAVVEAAPLHDAAGLRVRS